MHAPWQTCTVESCVGVRLPDGQRCLAHADPAGRGNALTAIGDGGAIDLRGTRLDSGLLEDIIAALPSGTYGPTWTGVLFDGATIEGADSALDLSGHSFLGEASFRGITAHRTIVLRSTRFETATFTGSVFNEHLDARRAAFGHAGFDESVFVEGLSVSDALVSGGCSLRWVRAVDVRLAGISVGEDIDFSHAAVELLDMTDATVGRDVLLHSATVDRALMRGIRIGGHVYSPHARISGWQPRPRRGVAERPADWEPEHPPVPIADLPPWHTDLVPASDVDRYSWVVVEEWVGASTAQSVDGGSLGSSGTIGLQISPWPVAGTGGLPRFDDEATQVAAVDAQALVSLLAERIGPEHETRIGKVYAIELAALPTGHVIQAPELAAAVTGTPVDVTAPARKAAQTATITAVVQPLDPRRDAGLVTALMTDDEGPR